MKNQASFSSKDKSKQFKCRLLQFLFGPLRVKHELSLVKQLHPCSSANVGNNPLTKACGLWYFLTQTDKSWYNNSFKNKLFTASKKPHFVFLKLLDLKSCCCCIVVLRPW